MDGQPTERTLELVGTSRGDAEALAHVDAMSDTELRAFVAGEHPMVVEAADAIIARGHAADRAAS